MELFRHRFTGKHAHSRSISNSGGSDTSVENSLSIRVAENFEGTATDDTRDANMGSKENLGPPDRKYWMPDAVATTCYDCEAKFTTFRRRHHCRVCGQIFCSKCCNSYIPGENVGCQGKK